MKSTTKFIFLIWIICGVLEAVSIYSGKFDADYLKFAIGITIFLLIFG
jgi:hypothetical protein